MTPARLTSGTSLRRGARRPRRDPKSEVPPANLPSCTGRSTLRDTRPISSVLTDRHRHWFPTLSQSHDALRRLRPSPSRQRARAQRCGGKLRVTPIHRRAAATRLDGLSGAHRGTRDDSMHHRWRCRSSTDTSKRLNSLPALAIGGGAVRLAAPIQVRTGQKTTQRIAGKYTAPQ